MRTKPLTACFSASGMTARAVKETAGAVGADLHKIRPVAPYASGGRDIGKAEKSMQNHCPGTTWMQGKLINYGAAAGAKSTLGM